jgi:hypothetical protein
MPIQGSVPALDQAVTATATLLRTGYVSLNAMEIDNPNASVVFVQLFDAATAGAVTLGTTTPVQAYQVPVGGAGNALVSRLIDYSNGPLRFSAGMVYAVTTTRTGSTAPASNCIINFRFS